MIKNTVSLLDTRMDLHLVVCRVIRSYWAGRLWTVHHLDWPMISSGSQISCLLSKDVPQSMRGLSMTTETRVVAQCILATPTPSV